MTVVPKDKRKIRSVSFAASTSFNDISDCDVLFGIKEVPKEKLIANKTYLYFSHTIKEQEYNRDLLKKMISLNIKMIDYEVLKHNDGSRILGFGRYAGIIGAYNGLLTYGLKKKLYSLKPAYMCVNRKEMEQELNKVKLTNEKFLVTGKGRVGSGILETINLLGIKEVSIDEYLSSQFDYPRSLVFSSFICREVKYFKRKDT